VAAWDRSRRRSGCQRRARHTGSIENGMPGDRAEGELEVAGEITQQAFELIGGVAGVGPGPAELGAEPAKGRADHARGRQLRPPSYGSFRDRLLARPGLSGPLESRADPGTHRVDDSSEHGSDRRAPPPKVGGHGRGGSA
jgi:hypothetical protein